MASAVEQDYATVEWSDTAIDVRRVESGLARLRREAAGSGFGTTTDVLNLIVYAEEEDVALSASATLASLSSRHPSRSIIIVASPAGEGIRTRLSAHCHFAPGMERHVCCEEILLTVRARGAAWLRSVILPLLIPDLPVFLWWNAALPRRPHLLTSLAETVDRLLLDSSALERSAGGLGSLSALVRKLRKACAVSDLNWARLKPWRQVIAQMFQGAGLRTYLERLDSAHIEYADAEGRGPVRAQLLLAWLASQLGWRPEGGLGDGQYDFSRDNRSVRCRLEAFDGSELEAGSILSTRLRAGEAGAEFRVERLDDWRLVCARVNAPGVHVESTMKIGGSELAEVLAEELQNPGADRVYEEALLVAAQVFGADYRYG